MNNINIKKKKLMAVWLILAGLAIGCLVILQYFSITEYNRIRAFKSAEILVRETEEIIAGNDADREKLQGFLREIYLEKAKTVSYVVDAHPELETDREGLQNLAKDMSVDQIHLFDETGRIYSSTEPDYYGLTLDSGEQIRYFKPMLKNRRLCMSQNFTRNTAENRPMLYAMCWNQAGTRMIQVGVSGERFPDILSRNRIDMFLDLIPDDSARDIILTDSGSDVIVASTAEDYTGKTLTDVGIDMEGIDCVRRTEFISGTGSRQIYCTAKEHQNYRIVIAQYRKTADENIPVTLFTFTEYLVLVFIAITFVLDHFYDRLIEEKNIATRDELTGLYNRRAYEIAMETLGSKPLGDDLILVAMDVNGLKTVNDSQGHQSGDVLLKGAAECMRQAFGSYGTLYRYGGDEFAAVLSVKDLQLLPLKNQFRQLCRHWSEENGLELWVSVGFAAAAEYPGKGIRELGGIADQKMYAEKARFYEGREHDRRGGSYEDK